MPRRFSRRALAVLPLLLTVPLLAVAAQQPKPSDEKATRWQSTDGTWQPLPAIFPSGGKMKVMHGDPATGVADFYFQFPAAYGVPMHFHTPVERLYVDKGTMEFEFRDGRKLSLAEGGFIHFPERSPHAARCTGTVDCFFYLNSSGPFDIHLIDSQGNVTKSWSASQAMTRR